MQRERERERERGGGGAEGNWGDARQCARGDLLGFGIWVKRVWCLEVGGWGSGFRARSEVLEDEGGWGIR